MTKNAKLLCAGFFDVKEHKGVCKGDSGGPLMVKDNGKFYLIGIVSYGADDKANGIYCKRGYPGIFTDVSRYDDWIAKSIKEL